MRGRASARSIPKTSGFPQTLIFFSHSECGIADNYFLVEGSTFRPSSDTLTRVSELKDFTRKLVKSKRKEDAVGRRKWRRQRRADRRLFRMVSSFVKRVLREMANIRYGRILWVWPRYCIQTISDLDSSDCGWQFYDSYCFPWDREPKYARFMVSLSKGNLYISSRPRPFRRMLRDVRT
jgi:hypothetical protein